MVRIRLVLDYSAGLAEAARDISRVNRRVFGLSDVSVSHSFVSLGLFAIHQLFLSLESKI